MAEQAMGRAQSYPVLGQIIADVQLAASGVCALPVERLQHWARFLWTTYPRHQHPRLYQMIGGMCLEFAQAGAFAAVQLYGLATLGASAEEAARLATTSDFLRAQGPDPLRLPTAPSTLNGVAPPTAGGAGIRRRTTGGF